MAFYLNKPFTNKEFASFVCEHQGLKSFETISAFCFLEPDEFIENDKIVKNLNYENEQLILAKNLKYSENEKLREEFFLQGVVYKNINFEMDLEQRQNLDYYSRKMINENIETVKWFASDGVSYLDCTVEDLLNIGALIENKIAYVWQIQNPKIKNLINNAKTLDELNQIQIKYDLN